MKLAMILFSFLCIFLGVYPQPLYEILPFYEQHVHHHPGEPLYQAFSGAHVVSQLQLLLFAGLAFFVLLPMLKRTLTITLDFDWFYRVAVPTLWKVIIWPFLYGIEPIHRGVTQGLPKVAARVFGAPPNPRNDRLQGWGVSRTVLLCTVFLLFFLLVNLLIR
jgi:multicomponent Na+:H+ antiporter subunit D